MENALCLSLVNSLDSETDCLVAVATLCDRSLSLLDGGLEVGLDNLVAGGLACGNKHSLLCGLNIGHSKHLLIRVQSHKSILT